MTKTKDRALKRELSELVGGMQHPGISVTLSADNGEVTLEDPRLICLDIATSIESEWREADAHLLRQWPYEEEEPYEYQKSALAASIGEGLIRRIERFAFLKDFDIGYLARYKEDKDGLPAWEEKGRQVLGKFAKVGERERHYSFHDFELIINWLVWIRMTPWQKVALIYHELRHADVSDSGQPGTQGHDWEGFLDELELFGTDTHRDWQNVARAASHAQSTPEQYRLPLL